jgi:hypothetical protein
LAANLNSWAGRIRPNLRGLPTLQPAKVRLLEGTARRETPTATAPDRAAAKISAPHLAAAEVPAAHTAATEVSTPSTEASAASAKASAATSSDASAATAATSTASPARQTGCWFKSQRKAHEQPGHDSPSVLSHLNDPPLIEAACQTIQW